ncbi:PAS domain S-box protein [Sulfurimonas aquatica]|uniref:PAS domain S-box protein n=1 Tax=Sulfurimonas aquatica TaxID=2672570 RepID=A0A975B115_9BACT|nr:PAS domain-containing protein [Sulfurimonas aquatica]QSZ42237.1 PAS domain S-box protein [Sulfurimonas aquatica]
MKQQELVFDFINTLSYPVVLVTQEQEDAEYIVSYSNQKMKNILNHKESLEPQLPSSFLEILDSHKEEIDANGIMVNNIEFSDKFYNINIIKNLNHILITFIEIEMENLFESITFKDIGSACSAMIVVLNDKGELVDANECFLAFVGIKKEEVLFKNFFQSFIPGSVEQLNQHFSKLLENDTNNNHFVTPLKDINGDGYRINWQVSKMVRQNQNFIIAVGSDISSLIEQSNNFKEKLDSIKVGFEYFPFAVGYMNSTGTFTTINKKFMKMFHIKDENAHIDFNQIPFFKKNIDFDQMSENIKLIKELSYKVKYPTKNKVLNISVDIRMLSGKKESSKLYIVVAHKIKS